MDTITPTSRIRRNRLVGVLRQMNLNPDNFVVFGSAPLLVHGIRASINDLDIVARGEVWQYVSMIGVPATGSYSGDRTWRFLDGDIQFSERWITSDWDTDALIDNAEIIDGIRFATLVDVLHYKEILRRPKDAPDIKALRERLGSVR